ncbi:hypothetical protein Btru_073251 [Bulinus truncatus]|nr:hypothetical protein Btru_073251 [Bulinus truncatus]
MSTHQEHVYPSRTCLTIKNMSTHQEHVYPSRTCLLIKNMSIHQEHVYSSRTCLPIKNMSTHQEHVYPSRTCLPIKNMSTHQEHVYPSRTCLPIKNMSTHQEHVYPSRTCLPIYTHCIHTFKCTDTRTCLLIKNMSTHQEHVYPSRTCLPIKNMSTHQEHVYPSIHTTLDFNQTVCSHVTGVVGTDWMAKVHSSSPLSNTQVVSTHGGQLVHSQDYGKYFEIQGTMNNNVSTVCVTLLGTYQGDETPSIFMTSHTVHETESSHVAKRGKYGEKNILNPSLLNLKTNLTF